MNLKLERYLFQEKSTIGHFYIDDGELFCHILEDKDRGLHQSDPLVTIMSEKVPHETAIPYGRYQVRLTHSPKFGFVTPEIINVPGYEGIRIHSGNKDTDTEGCLLTGDYKEGDQDWISNSRIEFKRLMDLLTQVPSDEEIWIDIVESEE